MLTHYLEVSKMKVFVIIMVGVVLSALPFALSKMNKTEDVAQTPFVDAQHFEYQGHQYINFTGWSWKTKTTVHNPDCSCLKK
jgi:hypothetical protein